MNKAGKIVIVAALAIAVAVVLVMKKTEVPSTAGEPFTTANEAAAQPPTRLPRLLDLGSKSCIPCKMMAPILEELKKEYAGRLHVEFIDVINQRPAAKEEYSIRMIPTQIFFDASGRELYRHVGFISKEDILATWKKLGVDLGRRSSAAFSRFEAPVQDHRPPESVCHMCDGDIDPRTRVSLKTDKGDVFLCSPHCYFILYSSLTNKEGVEGRVSTTDWATGEPLKATAAVYLRGIDHSGRPTIKAFAHTDAAWNERKAAGGNILGWKMLSVKEAAFRCGFCDRVVYPEDSSPVKAGGVCTWGCCPMCALGVAARTGLDIQAHVKDALTGEIVVVKTINGRLASLQPPTAVAWAGKVRAADGKLASAGCFKQAFFVGEPNLKKWVNEHPRATGMIVTISQALAAKMKLTPQQISKACKIGECAPR